MWTVLRLLTDVVDILPLDGSERAFFSSRLRRLPRKPPRPVPHPELDLVFAGPWPQFFEPEGLLQGRDSHDADMSRRSCDQGCRARWTVLSRCSGSRRNTLLGAWKRRLSSMRVLFTC